MFIAFLAAASSAQPMPPIGQWVVEFADDQCIASRRFGDVDNPWVLAIKPSPTSEVVQLILVRKSGPADAVQEGAQLRFGDSSPIKVNELRYSNKNSGIRLVNLTPDQALSLASADRVEWHGKGADGAFAIGPVKKLMSTLAACREDLRNHWNISPARSDALRQKARPKTPLVRMFSTDDYPGQAVSNREGGTTSVALLIDEKGVVQDCMVDGTSGIATLDAQTCIIIQKRVKFEPAIDKDGKPVKHHYMQRVRWEMP